MIIIKSFKITKCVPETLSWKISKADIERLVVNISEFQYAVTTAKRDEPSDSEVNVTIIPISSKEQTDIIPDDLLSNIRYSFAAKKKNRNKQGFAEC